MKIVIYDLEEWEHDRIPDFGSEHEVVLTDHSLTADTARQHADADIISLFVYSRPDVQTLQAFEHLRLIATRSTGVDHIPTEHCREHGIAIANVPSYGSHTVAEHVFALLLCISHRLEDAIDRTRKGDFTARGLNGFDLAGRTMGVIGTGDIGEHTARIARGFDMRVLGFDVKPRPEIAEQIGFEYVDMDRLLAESDVISLHVPASDQTEGLISGTEFQKMKPGCVLINTSRGIIIDTQALIRALVEGPLAAAGLDVLPREPVIREDAEVLRAVYEEKHDLRTLLADEVLIRLRNVVVTPHSAFHTREAVHRIIDTTVDNIASFIKQDAKNLVTTG
ncbi:MAG: NAD(P)-dependent oxidoreductase [Planctomycetota bacterium]